MADAPRFIGSAFAGPGHGWITLRGEIDAHAVELLEEHVDGFLGAATRMLTIDATRVTYCDPALIELLGCAQDRLTARGGTVAVIGLHPSALPAARSDPALTVVPTSPGPPPSTPAA